MMQFTTAPTRHTMWTYRFAAVALCAAVSLAATEVRADSSMVDITYSPSQSEMMPTFGIGVYNLKDVGPGFYLNGSFSGSPDNYYSGSCYYSCGSATSTKQGAALFAIGATFPLVTSDMKVPIYRTLHSYLGLGYGASPGMRSIPVRRRGTTTRTKTKQASTPTVA